MKVKTDDPLTFSKDISPKGEVQYFPEVSIYVYTVCSPLQSIRYKQGVLYIQRSPCQSLDKQNGEGFEQLVSLLAIYQKLLRIYSSSLVVYSACIPELQFCTLRLCQTPQYCTPLMDQCTKTCSPLSVKIHRNWTEIYEKLEFKVIIDSSS